MKKIKQEQRVFNTSRIMQQYCKYDKVGYYLKVDISLDPYNDFCPSIFLNSFEGYFMKNVQQVLGTGAGTPGRGEPVRRVLRRSSTE